MSGGHTSERDNGIAAMRRAFDASFSAPPPPTQQALISFVAIRLGDDPFAIQGSELSAIEPPRRIVALPGAPPGLLGVSGIRGKLVPIYALPRLLGCHDEREPRWLAVSTGDSPVGFVLPQLDGYLEVAPSAVHALAESDRRRQHVVAVLRSETQLRAVISIASLLSALAGQPARER